MPGGSLGMSALFLLFVLLLLADHAFIETDSFDFGLVRLAVGGVHAYETSPNPAPPLPPFFGIL